MRRDAEVPSPPARVSTVRPAGHRAPRRAPSMLEYGGLESRATITRRFGPFEAKVMFRRTPWKEESAEARARAGPKASPDAS